MGTLSYEPDAQGLVLQHLREALNGLMVIEEVLLLSNERQPVVQFAGQLVGVDQEQTFEEIFRRFEALDYTPLLVERDGTLLLQAHPGAARVKTGNPWVNVGLFAVTLLVVLFTGALYAGVENPLADLRALWQGLPFAGTLLGMLTVHELSHYGVARRYGSPVSLPYFIPLPLSILGTMGAVIVQRAPMRSRKALFDIGAAGPLGGLIVGIPLLVLGLSLSTIDVLPGNTQLMLEGNSLLYFVLKFLFTGRALPSGGFDIILHPVAFAAWAGLMVTALNLIPVGQLDGGHVAYALWGRKAWALARWIVMAMFVWGGLLLAAEYTPLGVAALSGYLGLPSIPAQIDTAGWTWLLWGVLVNFMGARHPAPLNDVTPLDAKRRALGWVMVVIFLLIIVPVPLTLVTL